MRRFASRTGVSIERSKAEIERLVTDYEATHFFSGWEKNAAIIGFRMNDRCVRFRLPLPNEDSHGKEKAAAESRRLWRVLALVLKAKLEAVASNVSDFETEFLGNITIPDGRTVGEWAKPQLRDAYKSGNMPPMLYSGGNGRDGS